MQIDVNEIVPGKSFEIKGMSYIGKPMSNTAMFLSKKAEHLIGALTEVDECLVFIEETIDIPDRLVGMHVFKKSPRPQLEYAKFANLFASERLKKEKNIPVSLTSQGYYCSADAVIGENAYIEPGCYIGPDVVVGKNAYIMVGTVIRHATIGDNFISNEYAIIGANGFTMTEDENGSKYRIPTLGRVMIGNYVEVGAHDNISCGSGGDTVIDDFVKLDALVHLGHDAYLHKNVEVAAGGVIGGFDEIGEHSYVGINAVLRNRIQVGNNSIVGMGATVTKSVAENIVVAGNPAKLLREAAEKKDK